MPMWRCPHCGTPQSEASRCWVCHRSSTICSTCRHFRKSLATSVGYCGLDARRAPLRGTEHRGCWTEGHREPAAGTSAAERSARDRPAAQAVPDLISERLDTPLARLRSGTPARPRERLIEGFVPVDQIDQGSRPTPDAPPSEPAAPGLEPPPPAVIDAVERWSDRETLFGDLEA